MEFKGTTGTELYGYPNILIESQWNLKEEAVKTNILRGTILIESQWNLKDNRRESSFRANPILIESQWNLKFIAS